MNLPDRLKNFGTKRLSLHHTPVHSLGTYNNWIMKKFYRTTARKIGFSMAAALTICAAAVHADEIKYRQVNLVSDLPDVAGTAHDHRPARLEFHHETFAPGLGAN